MNILIRDRALTAIERKIRLSAECFNTDYLTCEMWTRREREESVNIVTRDEIDGVANDQT